MLTTKTRKLTESLVIPPILETVVSSGSVIQIAPPVNIQTSSAQVTESEGHQRNRKGFFDSGGSFYTAKRIISKPTKIHFVGNEYAEKGFPGEHLARVIRYSGPFFPHDPLLMMNDMKATLNRSKDTSDLDKVGATAISRCSPVNPVDTLGQGLVEGYHDGLPSIPGIQTWRRRADIVRAAGSEFLNAVFGWKPLVSEVRDFSSTVRDSRDILKQYHKNQGTNVHREFHFPIDISVGEPSVVAKEVHAFIGTGLGGGGFSLDWHTDQVGKVLRSVTQSTEQWFSGSFTYGVPSQSDSWRRMLGYGSDADKLFGIALTPELLWNVAPWSWAVDWFSNAGDVIRNVSNFSGAGQVMRYGYMMETKVTTITYTMDRSGVFIRGQEIPAPIFEMKFISKVRRPANPYGFGITSGSLSPLQIAIVAALGITLL